MYIEAIPEKMKAKEVCVSNCFYNTAYSLIWIRLTYFLRCTEIASDFMRIKWSSWNIKSEELCMGYRKIGNINLCYLQYASLIISLLEFPRKLLLMAVGWMNYHDHNHPFIFENLFLLIFCYYSHLCTCSHNSIKYYCNVLR